jgi:serine protease Do
MVSQRVCGKFCLAIMGLLLCGAMPTSSVFAQNRQIQQIQIFHDGLEGAFLGIQMEDVTAAKMGEYKLSAERGVIVRSVEKGSPAEAANLQVNDVILEWESVQVWSSTQMVRLVRETPPGRRVGLGISRNGKKMSLSVIVGKREAQGLDGRYLRALPPGPGWEVGPGAGDRTFEFRLPGRGGPFGPGMGDAEPNLEGQPRLGVTVQPLTGQLAEFLSVPGRQGVLVTSVREGQPAFNKLRAGDVIVRVDGKTVESPEALIRIVQDPRKAKLELTIIRDKQELAVEVPLSESSDGSRRGYKL